MSERMDLEQNNALLEGLVKIKIQKSTRNHFRSCNSVISYSKLSSRFYGGSSKVCGVTKATVYYYYSTKADLFTATMIEMMVRIRENMSQILSTNKTLEERLLDFAKVYLHATMDIDMKNFMKDAKLSLSEEQLKQLKMLKIICMKY